MTSGNILNKIIGRHAESVPHCRAPASPLLSGGALATGALIGPSATGTRVALTVASVPRWARRVAKRLTALLPSFASADMTAAGTNGSNEATPAVPLTAKQERAWRELTRLHKYFVIVLDHKGGIGKSLMVQVSYEVLSVGINDNKVNVLVLDADFVNKNLVPAQPGAGRWHPHSVLRMAA